MMERGGLRRCDSVEKKLRVIRVEDYDIKIRGLNVSTNLDILYHMLGFIFCM